MGLLLPPLSQLKKLAAQRPNLEAASSSGLDAPRALRRRLNPDRIAEIVAKYRNGATTPALCTEYSLSKGGLLKLLREEGVQLRRQPLSVEQVTEASAMYVDGRSLSAVAKHFNVSYGGLRQALIRAGVERRPRGGSEPRTNAQATPPGEPWLSGPSSRMIKTGERVAHEKDMALTMGGDISLDDSGNAATSIMGETQCV